MHTCMHMVSAHVYIQLYRGYLYVYTRVQTALHTLYVHVDSQHTCSSAQTYTQYQRRHPERQHMSRYHYMCVTHTHQYECACTGAYVHTYIYTHICPILPFHAHTQSSISLRASRHPHRVNSTYAYTHMDICAHIYTHTYYQHTCLHLIHPSTRTPQPETHAYITSICAQNRAHVHIHYCPALIHIEDYTPPPHTSTHVATCAKPPARTHPRPA